MQNAGYFTVHWFAPGSRAKFFQHAHNRDSVDFQYLVSRGAAADQFQFAARAIERVGQQTEQRLVCGGVHRWRGDADAEFRALRSADLVLRGAGLQFDGERDAVGLGGDETGELPLTPSLTPSDGERVAARPGEGFVFPVVHSPGTLPESLPR